MRKTDLVLVAVAAGAAAILGWRLAAQAGARSLTGSGPHRADARAKEPDRDSCDVLFEGDLEGRGGRGRTGLGALRRRAVAVVGAETPDAAPLVARCPASAGGLEVVVLPVAAEEADAALEPIASFGARARGDTGPLRYVAALVDWSGFGSQELNQRRAVASRLAAAGARLVISARGGLREIERTGSSFALFGLGNNGRGETAEGAVLRLMVEGRETGPNVALRLYPTRGGELAPAGDLGEAYWKILVRGAKYDWKLKQILRPGHDAFGGFIALGTER